MELLTTLYLFFIGVSTRWDLMYVDLSRGFGPTVACVCYGSVPRGSFPSILDSYVYTLTPHIMIMIMDYAVQYICFTKRKCFVRFSISLIEPIAHKIIWCVIGQGKEKAFDM